MSHRTVITADSLGWQDSRPISPAIRAGDLLFVSSQSSVDENGRLIHAGDISAQSETVFRRIADILEAAGGKMSDVLDLVAFFPDIRDAEHVLGTARSFFEGDYPTWTLMGTQGL